MLVVLVELCARFRVVEAIEVGEQVRLVGRLLPAALEIVDDCLGVNFLLNEDLRLRNDEVGPVLTVLATPDKLRVADLDLALLQKPPRLLFRDANARPLPDDLRIEVLVALARLALGQRTRPLVMRGLRRVLLLDALGDRLIFGGRDIAPRAPCRA